MLSLLSVLLSELFGLLLLLPAFVARVRPREAESGAERLRQDRPQTGGGGHRQSHKDVHQWAVGGGTEREGGTFSLHTRRVY